MAVVFDNPQDTSSGGMHAHTYDFCRGTHNARVEFVRADGLCRERQGLHGQLPRKTKERGSVEPVPAWVLPGAMQLLCRRTCRRAAQIRSCNRCFAGVPGELPDQDAHAAGLFAKSHK